MDWKEKLNIYREFYEDIKPSIYNSDPTKFVDRRGLSKVVSKIGLFSPIEDAIWNICEDERISLYPQYPLFNFMVDFCNPVRKVVVECDGLKYHNYSKDLARDEFLVSKGYRVFRLSGSKILTDHASLLEEIYNDLYSEPEEYLLEELIHSDFEKYYLNTSMGFVEALRDIVILEKHKRESVIHFDYKLKSLAVNRIIDFTILPEFREISSFLKY